MDVVETGRLVAVMVAPTVLLGTGLVLPRAVRAVRRAVRRRRVDELLEPSRPPIEELAADLRRLLQRHEAVKASTGVAMRARHLHAIQAAIGDCAQEAALAVGVAGPSAARGGELTTPQLRQLLRSLTDAGLVLVPATGLLAPDGHS